MNAACPFAGPELLLIEELRTRIGEEQSLFRAQILREDVARLTTLRDLARAANDVEAFKKAARRIGWTQGDARTEELGDVLDRLLDAVFAYQTGADEEREERIRDAWLDLYRLRMERLVGCLSTPAPRPVD
jgi:hypothetical protein